MGRWAKPTVSREQIVLFSPTLDDSISPDHSVRLFEELLAALDFGEWESHYVLVEGRPPIHPRTLGAVILYGLSLGIRSSRKLEEATVNRLDFIWLTHGRMIDHSTLCGFRTRFEQPLKGLFRQIGRMAIGMGMAQLNQVSLDGTTKRSNNSVQATASAGNLAQKLSALDEQIEAMLTEARQTDVQEQELYGESSPGKLPRALRDLKARQQRLAEALKKVQEMDRRCDGKPPKVPTTDPESSVLPNKSGGYAPNYTLLAATEGQNGLIVAAEVAEGNDEAGSVLPVMKTIEADFEHKPEELLADSGFNSGRNLQQLQQEQIEPYMPPKQTPGQDNPALRSDVTEPVEQAQWQKLPKSPRQKVLDKSAFVYQAWGDCYHCPMGQKLSFVGMTTYVRLTIKGRYRNYEPQAGACADCPLRSECLIGKRPVRRLVRDEYEPLREAMAERMHSAEGKARYKRRSFLSETPFAVMSTTMNVRQMLLRGMSKVRIEWRWICTAYNLKKLMNLMPHPRPATA